MLVSPRSRMLIATGTVQKESKDVNGGQTLNNPYTQEQQQGPFASGHRLRGPDAEQIEYFEMGAAPACHERKDSMISALGCGILKV